MLERVVKFLDLHKKSIKIKYEYRQNTDDTKWAYNNVFTIEGSIKNLEVAKGANERQNALIEFVLKHDHTQGAYLTEFNSLCEAVEEVERKRDIALLNNKTDTEMFDIINNFLVDNEVKFNDIGRALALLKHLQNKFLLPIECLLEITEENDDEVFKIFNRDYIVVDDARADDMVDDYYRYNVAVAELLGINEDVFEKIERYFDIEQFITDCKKDGRGVVLAGYNGKEHEISLDITDNDNQIVFKDVMYIYRQN
jgi:hypothetical protein